MAIIRTDHATGVISDILVGLRDALQNGDGRNIAKDVVNVATQAAAIPLGQDSATGGNAEGTHVTLATKAAASQSYTVSYQDYSSSDWYGNPWLRDSVERRVLSGTDLDGANGVATRFVLSYGDSRDCVAPGLTASYRAKENIAADIRYELANADSLTVGNYQVSYSNASMASGYGPGGSYEGASKSDSYTSSKVFRGSSTFDIAGGNATIVSTELYAYSFSERSQSKSDGDSSNEAYLARESGTFALTSASGLFYTRAGDGTVGITGGVSSIRYLAKESIVSQSSPYAVDDTFIYTNGAAPADDLDLDLLAAYFTNPSQENRLAVISDFLKGDDQITVTDHIDGGYIEAGAGNDRVIGGRAEDRIWGEDGADWLDGGAGNDQLGGGEGNDSLKGGAGDDRLRGEAGDDLLDGGAGNDHLSGDEGNDKLAGGAGNDRLDADAGADWLDGGSGNDWLDAGAGNDSLKGGAGNDWLDGGAGDDVLEGGTGNDYIDGGAGLDLMSGGTGIDGFFFAAGDSGDAALSLASLDRISDFNVSQDHLLLDFDFSDSDIRVLTAAEEATLGQAGSYDTLLAAAEAQDKRIVVGYDNANTYVFVDSDGNGELDLAVTLLGIKGAALASALQFF